MAKAVIMDQALLGRVSALAKESPRLRKNYNFHPDDDFCCHRLLNGMEPGSYIQPHRHLPETKDESIVVVRGRVGFVAFDEQGSVILARTLTAGGEAFAVDIPHGMYHTLVSLSSDSVFFEAKAGPFRPLDKREKAPWAPEEGDPKVPSFLAGLEQLFPESPVACP